ncbi:MAG: ATP-grasp domain-containing protein [Spirochaetaceae bacterium]|nr:MAG: ATP-grasp domain-containing protein [Spirochaetaceae bacterium]
MTRKPSTKADSPAPRVIVTYARSLMSLVIAHSLGKRQIEVYGCDDVDLTVMSFSRYVKKTFVHAPLDDPDRFLDDLLAKVKKFKPNDDRPYVLMPVFRETELIAQNRHLFEPHIRVAAPDHSSIARVHPKDHLAATAIALGVPAPYTWTVSSGEEIDAIAPRLPYPVLIKPPDETGGRGIEVCVSQRDLRERTRTYSFDRWKLLLIQEFAPGEDYCLTVLFERGQLKASMAYKNLRKFPPDSGAGIVRETVDDSAFLDVARDLLGPLHWNGIAELDFRWNGSPDYPPQLIEVNPRFWAGLFQSVESGIDFPWLLYQLTVHGHAPTPRQIAIGKRTKIPGLWLLSAVRDVSNSQNRFDRVREAWQLAWKKIENKQIRDAFQILGTSLDTRSGFRETVAALRAIVQDGRSAKNDLFYRDDPFIVLGVMFILASLIRHGKLPPEVKNR